MGRDHFTGIPNIVLEDVAVQESQGAIYDRTREHLGSSDRLITSARRLLLGAVRRHDDTGGTFPALDVALREVRALAVDIPDGVDWRRLPV